MPDPDAVGFQSGRDSMKHGQQRERASSVRFRYTA
jgi:hypothetical protein